MNQQGTTVYVNEQQFQRTADTDGLRTFLGEMHLEKEQAFWDDVKYIFQNGSQNRSYFFANVRYRDYAPYVRGLSFMLPVYGVKGQVSAISSRVSFYTELLTCREEDLAGTGFNSLVFGTDYMTDAESIASSREDIRAIMQRSKTPVSCTFDEGDIDAVCRVVEKLWEVQETDPSTRFIIRMDHAEDRSMKLLQKIYMLLPFRLRLQLGFETNVTEKDLKLIHERGGFPIYILTADREETFNIQNYSFPVFIYDYDRADSYLYDEKKLEVLHLVALNMNELDTVLLDYSEKRIMQEKEKKYSSFRYYGEIVSNMNNVEYWWRSKTVDTVERLHELYDDQRELLNNQDLKKEADYEFLTKILPQDTLSEQLVDIVNQENYQNRSTLLKFLTDELFQKTQVHALFRMHDVVKKENEIVLQLHNAEHAKKIAQIEDRYEEQLDELRREAQTIQTEFDNISRENETYENELRKVKKENEGLSNQVHELKNDIDQMSRAHNRSSVSRTVEELKKRLRLQRFLMGLAGLIVAGAVGFSVYSTTSRMKADAKLIDVQKQLDEKNVTIQTLEGQIEKMGAQDETETHVKEEPEPEIDAEKNGSIADKTEEDQKSSGENKSDTWEDENMDSTDENDRGEDVEANQEEPEIEQEIE